MIGDKGLDHIVDTIDHFPAPQLKLLGGRVAPLQPSRKYPLRGGTGLMDRDAAEGPMVYFRSRDLPPCVRYNAMNTFRPFGVTFTPNPGRVESQYTASADLG